MLKNAKKISKMLKIGICNATFCCCFAIAGTITRETENKGDKNKIEVFEEENKDISWNNTNCGRERTIVRIIYQVSQKKGGVVDATMFTPLRS